MDNEIILSVAEVEKLSYLLGLKGVPTDVFEYIVIELIEKVG